MQLTPQDFWILQILWRGYGTKWNLNFLTIRGGGNHEKIASNFINFCFTIGMQFV